MIDVRRIPIVGGDMYQVGQVVDIMTQPCQPDPLIAVQAFFYNTPQLLFSLFKPEPEDYLSNRFGGRHTKKRKGRFQAMDRIPMGGGKLGQLAWWSHQGRALVERVGWYFLVVDATTDFVINWTSMAYKFSGCEAPGAQWAALDLGPAVTRSDGNEWNDFPPAVNRASSQQNILAGPNSITVNQPLPHSVSFACTFSRGSGILPRLPDQVRMKIRRNGIDTFRDLENNRPGDPLKSAYNFLDPHFFPVGSTVYTPQYHTNTLGTCVCNSYTLNGSAFKPNFGLQPDP